MPLYPAIQAFAAQRQAEFRRISEARRKTLAELADWVRGQRAAGRMARLNFICTHNSRRSQISQIWSWTAAAVHGVDGVETFSGGTQATAFNRRAVEALRRAGFVIEAESAGDNPVYSVRRHDEAVAIRTFSKLHDRKPNPTRDFCAVMNCSSADADCPVIPGATRRVSLPYDDPGEADGTRFEGQAYDRCCRRIGREMLYLFSRVEN